jgi:nucleotide-binding universal stress UspA family protein
MRNDRILVGYDGSPGADAALERALRLRELGDTLIAATVCEEGWASLAGPVASHAADELRFEADEAHARAVERLRDEPGAEAELVHGRAADALLALARRHEATLVVVGRSPHRSVRSVLFGDVAATLVRSAPCSVLVVDYERGNALPASAGTTWAVTQSGVDA